MFSSVVPRGEEGGPLLQHLYGPCLYLHQDCPTDQRNLSWFRHGESSAAGYLQCRHVVAVLAHTKMALRTLPFPFSGKTADQILVFGLLKFVQWVVYYSSST